MARVLILRACLAAIPFVVWFLWRAWAQRTGRPMGSTPWSWLVAAGGLLVGLSLVGTAVFHPDNRGQTYVPGEVMANGDVSPGRFKPKPAAK